MKLLHQSVILVLFCAFQGGVCTGPTSTQLFTNKSSNVFLQGDAVLLNCSSSSGKFPCTIAFYQGNSLLANVSSNDVCHATHVVTSIQGCSNVMFSCKASNSDGQGIKTDLNVTVQAPPKITVESADRNNKIAVKEGSSFVLKCSASGCPTPNVTEWTKQGQTLIRGLGNNLNYSFPNLTRNDNGDYVCTAYNGVTGSPTRKTISLDVQYLPEKAKVSVNKLVFNKDDMVNMTCSAQANPSRCTLFFYQGQTLVGSFINDGCSHTVSFPIESCDVSYLKCITFNTIGRGDSSSVDITVQARPTVSSLSALVDGKIESIWTFKKGRNLTLQCKTKGCPTAYMEWKKEGVTLDSGTTTTLLHEFISSGLVKDDSGTYTCTARNLRGVDSKSIYLDVTYEPIITLSESTVTLSSNQKLNVTCDVDANPPATNIEWTWNDTVIARGENMLLNASNSFQGNYTCTATNALGTESKTVGVTVNACVNNKCQHQSACSSSVGSLYRCTCERGYLGKYCETKDPLNSKLKIIIVLISTSWVDDYRDTSSKAFKTLQDKICSEFRKVLKMFNLVITGCKVLSLRKGSVISDVELELENSRYRSEIEEILRNATSNNTLGDLPISRTIKVIMNEPNPCEGEPCKNDGQCIVDGQGYKCDCKHFRSGKHCESGLSLAAGIVLIVLACLVVLILILVIIYCCCCRKGDNISIGKGHKPLETELKAVRRRGSEYPKGVTNEMYVEDERHSGSYDLSKAEASNRIKNDKHYVEHKNAANGSEVIALSNIENKVTSETKSFEYSEPEESQSKNNEPNNEATVTFEDANNVNAELNDFTTTVDIGAFESDEDEENVYNVNDDQVQDDKEVSNVYHVEDKLEADGNVNEDDEKLVNGAGEDTNYYEDGEKEKNGVVEEGPPSDDDIQNKSEENGENDMEKEAKQSTSSSDSDTDEDENHDDIDKEQEESVEVDQQNVINSENSDAENN